MTDLIPIRFEGMTIAARRGEPLAAALAAHGHLVLRTTRTGARRGVFCGMGACQDCLVVIDGMPNRRACMEKVDRSMTVEREAHGRPLPPVRSAPPPRLIDDIAVDRPEVLVVGAGPGGLAAALAARRAGAEVLLVDERSAPGGQYFKQSAVGGPADAQQRDGAALIAETLASGVEIRSGVTVWGATPPLGFACTVDGRTRLIEPAAAIVATGATERAWPVPGWTLPGVMTTGAAQTLWRTARRLPGRRVAIAGNGPLNLQLATELKAGGAEIVAIAELASAPDLAMLADVARMAMAAPRLLARGIAMTARLGGTIRHGTHVARIDETADGLSVVFAGARPGVVEADILCLSYGFRPADALLGLIGDGDGASFAVGDCTGLGGAQAALAEGTLAGFAAAERLGHVPSAELERARRRAQKRLARHRRFQAALWRIHACDFRAPSGADTILCRCEEVTFGRIAAARAEGIGSIGGIKQETRCGMGACQGRYCGPLLESLMERENGFSSRMPTSPVRIDELG